MSGGCHETPFGSRPPSAQTHTPGRLSWVQLGAGPRRGPRQDERAENGAQWSEAFLQGRWWMPRVPGLRGGGPEAGVGGRDPLQLSAAENSCRGARRC